VAVRVPGGTAVPDVVVLRPAANLDAAFVDPADVALVVEVESPTSRRLDRHIKPALYAEAGIEAYRRIERTSNGPTAHLYTLTKSGKYLQHRSVNTGETVLAEPPYETPVAPATWST
jgi:Uma2 family endonuclease